MTVPTKLFDMVAVTEDLPALGLSAGEVGAVVEVYDDGKAYEVEFCEPSGSTYGLHTLRAGQVIPLHLRGQAWMPRAGAA